MEQILSCVFSDYSRPLSFARIFENLTPFPRERERQTDRELKEEREQNEFPEEEIQQMGGKKGHKR